MSTSEQINEYHHRNGEDAISVPAGSEADLVFAADTDWELVGDTPAASEPVEPEAEDHDEGEHPVDPDAHNREELNAIAIECGVEDPESFGTKAEFAEAINNPEGDSHESE